MTLVLKLKLDKVFNSLLNAGRRRANVLVNVSKPLKGKSPRGHIAHRAWSVRVKCVEERG